MLISIYIVRHYHIYIYILILHPCQKIISPNIFLILEMKQLNSIESLGKSSKIR